MPLAAQQPARAEVLVVGVFHMANPGHDLHSTSVDDVLSPTRQAEIAQVIATLAKFHPTKIAVEWDGYDNSRLAQRYDDYLAGKRELTRNEIDQIGLRLAKELGHKTIYGVDVDGDFPYQRVVNFAKASGRTKELDAWNDDVAAVVKAQNEFLAAHTILETLLYINADDKIAAGTESYFRLAHFGESGDWAGADLVADWFRRNMRIYSNVQRLAASSSDRVLVIYGSGHLGWLQFAFANDPTIRLRKLSDLAK